MQRPVPLHIRVHQWRKSWRRNVPERLVQVLSRKQCGTLLRHHNLKLNRERCTCWIQQFCMRALYNPSVFQQFGLTFASLFYFCYCAKLCSNVLFCRRAPRVLCLYLVIALLHPRTNAVRGMLLKIAPWGNVAWRSVTVLSVQAR